MKRQSPRPEVFLAHSSRDKEFVQRLAIDLKSFGIPVWYDAWNMKVGESIRRKIEQAISMSGYLAVVLSPSSVESKWVNVELSAALSEELDRGNVFVLPILYQRCPIPVFLRDKLYADFTESYNAGMDALVQTVLPKRLLDRLIRLPADGGVMSTKELEEKLCVIYENKLTIHREYCFSFISLETFPDEVFAHFEGSKASLPIAHLKGLRRRLAREKFSSNLMTSYDIVAEAQLVDYARTGSYYIGQVPKRLRRIHLGSLVQTLQTTDRYRVAISRDNLPQWFLTYRVGTKKVCYVSRQFPSSTLSEPFGLFTRDPHTFNTFKNSFLKIVSSDKTISIKEEVIKFLNDLISKYC